MQCGIPQQMRVHPERDDDEHRERKHRELGVGQAEPTQPRVQHDERGTDEGQRVHPGQAIDLYLLLLLSPSHYHHRSSCLFVAAIIPYICF